MTLLDDIIQAAVDNKQSVSVLLRKCLLLAHEIKDDQVKSWANQELNGYSSQDGLPDYRILYVGAKGNFSGPFGAALQNYPIAPALLEKQHQHFATDLHLKQPISAYEGASSHDDGSMSYEWPTNLCAYYQDKVYDGYVLVTAWQTVPKSALLAILDTIRNRSLNLALEIKDEVGDTSNLRIITAAEAEKVSEKIAQNIFNGPAYFASTGSHFNVTTNNTQTVISVGDRENLDKTLLQVGLEPQDIKQLDQAMQSDGNNTMGSRVSSSIKQTAPKVIQSGVKVGTEVAQSLLSTWLKQYYGLT